MLLTNKHSKKTYEINVTIKYLTQKYDYCLLMMYTGISVHNLKMAARWFEKTKILKKAIKIAKKDLELLNQ